MKIKIKGKQLSKIRKTLRAKVYNQNQSPAMVSTLHDYTVDTELFART